MGNPYIISQEAIDDLGNIWIFTLHNWSAEQADRYHDIIINEIEYISSNFMIGKSFEHIKSGYRASKVKSHLIFYKMNDNNIVEIIRILHQRMDVSNKLKD